MGYNILDYTISGLWGQSAVVALINNSGDAGAVTPKRDVGVCVCRQHTQASFFSKWFTTRSTIHKKGQSSLPHWNTWHIRPDTPAAAVQCQEQQTLGRTTKSTTAYENQPNRTLI